MTTRVALAVAVLIVAAPPWGTPKTEIGADASIQGQGTTTPQAQPGMQDMMKMHEQMMAEMKGNRAKLDALVQQMNSAPGTLLDDGAVGPYAGPYGLGRQLALAGRTLRPFRKLISAQAIYRREVVE